MPPGGGGMGDPVPIVWEAPWYEWDTNLWPIILHFHSLHITYRRVEAFVSYMDGGTNPDRKLAVAQLVDALH
jgi:hypothetical protein